MRVVSSSVPTCTATEEFTWPASWTPVQTIGSLLASMSSLLRADVYSVGHLSEETYREAINRHNAYLQHETLRVAVCNAVEACLQGTYGCPRGLAELVVVQKFVSYYNRYREIIEFNLHLSGKEMRTFAGSLKGTFDYHVLLDRLEDLLERLTSTYGIISASV
nr:ubiquitin-conjugating enzyme E2 Z-like [Rhipicephalus microplus]